MASGIQFGAPWGRLLKAFTILTIIILVVIVAFGLLTGPRAGVEGTVWYIAMVVFPLLVILFSLPFGVRGYTLSRGMLFIRRFGWESRVELKDLRKVEIDPEAMARSIRTFGNGGFFGFTGYYWSRRFGHYRMYATDPRLSVVLYFARGIMVVTPDDPKAFVRNIRMLNSIPDQEQHPNID